MSNLKLEKLNACQASTQQSVKTIDPDFGRIICCGEGFGQLSCQEYAKLELDVA